MSTKTYGTGAGDKWSDGGATLSGGVFRVNGASDMCLMEQTPLATGGGTVFVHEYCAKQNYQDQSANANHATSNSKMTLSDDGYASADNDAGLTIPDSASLDNPTSAYTAECWVKPYNITRADNMYIMSRRTATTIWNLRTGTVAQDRLEFLYGSGTKYSDADVIENQQWYHIMYSSSAGNVDFTVNGSDVWASGAHSDLTTGTVNVTIANRPALSASFCGRYAAARLSASKDYDGAFTPYRFPASSTVTVVADGGANSDWSNIAHTRTVADDYEGSVSQLRYRAGADNPPTGGWTTISSPAVSEDIAVTGQYLQVEFTLTPKADTNRTETPQLLTATLTYTAAAAGSSRRRRLIAA